MARRRFSRAPPRAQPPGDAADATGSDAGADSDADPAALPAMRTSLACGELTVGLIAEADVRGAAVLLTRAFAGTPEAVSLDEAT